LLSIKIGDFDKHEAFLISIGTICFLLSTKIEDFEKLKHFDKHESIYQRFNIPSKKTCIELGFQEILKDFLTIKQSCGIQPRLF